MISPIINHFYYSEKPIQQRMVNLQLNYLRRDNGHTIEYLQGVNKYIVCKNSLPGIFLLPMVNKEVTKFIESHPEVKTLSRSDKDNNFVFDKNMGFGKAIMLANEGGYINDMKCIDIKGAYWMAAYRLGIISLKTYEKGEPDEFKLARNVSLGILGTNKEYVQYFGDKKIKKVVFEGEDYLKNIYLLVAQEISDLMHYIRKKLPPDMVYGWKTDCIFFSGELSQKVMKEINLNGYTGTLKDCEVVKIKDEVYSVRTDLNINNIRVAVKVGKTTVVL